MAALVVLLRWIIGETVRSTGFTERDRPLTPAIAAFPLNCTGMYRGQVRVEDGRLLTAIFDDEELSELPHV